MFKHIEVRLGAKKQMGGLLTYDKEFRLRIENLLYRQLNWRISNCPSIYLEAHPKQKKH